MKTKNEKLIVDSRNKTSALIDTFLSALDVAQNETERDEIYSLANDRIGILSQVFQRAVKKPTAVNAVDPCDTDFPEPCRVYAMEGLTVVLSDYNSGEIYVGTITADGEEFEIKTGDRESNRFVCRSIQNIAECNGGYVLTYCPPVDELL